MAKAEREGALTRLNIAKVAIDDALSVSCNLRELRYHLSTMGYICQFDENRKYWTIRQEEWKRPIRLIRMGEEYSNDNIRKRLRDNTPEVRKGIVYRDIRKCRRRSHTMKKGKSRKVGGLRGLYYHYCYLLGYMPKRNMKPYQVSPALRDDLIKLNEISKEVRLLQEHRIDDLQQLFDYRKNCNERVFEIRAQIKKAQSKKGADKTEIGLLKGELKKLRFQIILCDRITRRSQQMNEKLQQVCEEQNRKREELIK